MELGVWCHRLLVGAHWVSLSIVFLKGVVLSRHNLKHGFNFKLNQGYTIIVNILEGARLLR